LGVSAAELNSYDLSIEIAQPSNSCAFVDECQQFCHESGFVERLEQHLVHPTRLEQCHVSRQCIARDTCRRRTTGAPNIIIIKTLCTWA
jgi:hypothetical protein